MNKITEGILVGAFYLLTNLYNPAISSAGTTINGVRLPDRFSGSIINSVAISGDGNEYAYISKNKDLIIGDIPDNRKIFVDGKTITVGKKSSSNSNSISVFASGGLISISGNRITVGGGLEHEINKCYSSVDDVTLKSSFTDVDLSLNGGGKICVQGKTMDKPIYSSSSLIIDGLDGILSIPKSKNLNLNVRSSAGDIEGDVAHGGRLSTSAGDIEIDIYAPMKIIADTSAGNIDVKGMVSQGGGVYVPLNQNYNKTLYLNTSAGDIEVDCKFK